MASIMRFTAALLVLTLVVSGGALWAQQAGQIKAGQGAAAPTAPAIDQRALDMLKKMSDTLSQAKTVGFQARSMVPIRTPDGIWINLYGTSRVVMQGPDKLFASTGGDFAPYDFYYDGKTITAFAPNKNLYAVKAAPATVDEMIEEAYRNDGKSFPYADILISEPYAALTEGLIKAYYVGQSTIRPLSGKGSVKADHLVFAHKAVEWQIWIDTDDHLPRLVVATYLDEINEPSYSVEFGDWKLNEPVSPETFVFNNASQAARVEFRNPFQGRRMAPPGSAAAETAGRAK